MAEDEPEKCVAACPLCTAIVAGRWYRARGQIILIHACPVLHQPGDVTVRFNADTDPNYDWELGKDAPRH